MIAGQYNSTHIEVCGKSEIDAAFGSITAGLVRIEE